jgi:hypothetical protein
MSLALMDSGRPHDSDLERPCMARTWDIGFAERTEDRSTATMGLGCTSELELGSVSMLLRRAGEGALFAKRSPCGLQLLGAVRQTSRCLS